MKERDQQFEINLNQMMAHEYLNRHSIPPQFAGLVVVFLDLKKMHQLLDDVLKETDCKNAEELIAKHPHMYYCSGDGIIEDGKRKQIVFNLWTSYDVQPGDFKYERFFAQKLSQLSVYYVYPFLDYHLENYYSGDFPKFKLFLRLFIKEFSDYLLPDKNLSTVESWIQDNENNKQKDNEDEGHTLTGNPKPHAVYWSGNKVDFIKLVYALYETGMLSDGNGSKTKLAENLATFLGVNYNSKDNDLSKSIGEAEKHGYDIRKFFDDLKAGFDNYLLSLQK